MTLVSSIASLTLDLPPSSIAFIPRHPQLFVVGTYHLHGKEHEGDLSADQASKAPDQGQDQGQDQASTHHSSASASAASPPGSAAHDDDAAATASRIPQKRTGSLILHRLDHDNNITRLSTTPTDFAILDIQWGPCSDAVDHGKDSILAVAASTGIVAFYHLNADADELVLIRQTQVADPSILVLSLAWNPQQPGILGLTLSDGTVCLCENALSADPAIVSQVHAHSLEAWTLAFNPHNPPQILSGGDDVILQSSHSTWRDRRLHSAGVTAIHPIADSLVVTGSYDDHIRLLSCPPTGKRKCLVELNLGGGVWRLHRLGGSEQSAISSSAEIRILFLASCMHAGTRIVELVRDHDGDEDWRFQVLARFEEHKSMNYASAVAMSGEEVGKIKVVSTSFYDRLLCVWETEL